MDISAWMIDSVSVASPNGSVDAAGQNQYDTPRTVPCRLEQATKLVVGTNLGGIGNEREAKHRISCDQELTWQDRFWLPGEDTSTTDPKRPLEVKSASTKDGSYTIWEVWL